MLIQVKQRINVCYLHKKYVLMAWNRAITSSANILKSIQICSDIFTELSSTLYNDMDKTFGYLFREYTKPSLKDIDHHAFI